MTLVPSAIADHATSDKSCCLDTGCGITLIDCSWLNQRLLNQKISKMTVLLKVKEIGSAKHNSDKFVFVPLYFLYRDKSKQLVYAQIDQELHLVDGLRANMLIWNNIIGREQISINIAERTALVASYGVCIPISARQRSQPLIKKILNAEAMTLLSRTETFVSVLSIGFPDNQDFFF